MVDNPDLVTAHSMDDRSRFDPTHSFSDVTMKKAAKLRDITQDEDHPEVWWIRDRQYRVQVYEGWATCTCPHGMNHVPAVCYHVAAVLRQMGRL